MLLVRRTRLVDAERVIQFLRPWRAGVSDQSPQYWIKSFALRPRFLSSGGWVWLRPYEWRWARPSGSAPMALLMPEVESRRVRSR